MSSTIVVPELSESVSEARVGRWQKQEGDRVSAGDVLVELETDKVDLEVGADTAGVLAKILHEEGDEVQVGDELAVIEPGEGDDGEESSEKASVTRDGESAKKESGSTDKDDDGSEEGRERSASQDQEEKRKKRRPEKEEEALDTDDESPPAKPASPSARRLAREEDVDLSAVARETKRNRITREDVEKFLDEHEDAKEATKPKGKTETSEGDSRREELVRMSGRRRTIARRLVEAQRNAAMLTTFNEIDMTALMELRASQQDRFSERHGVRLGIVSFFVRAAIGALRAFPKLNAEVRDDAMLVKHYYDIGVAVGDPEGLVVPVLRDADRLSLASIEKRIKELAEKANQGRLTAEELAGGTFTITNGGVFGSLLSTPILNPPQVGILGLHKIEERAVVIDSRVQVRPMMYVALSYDHRIVDGLEAVQFLGRVKELIESSETLLLEG